MSAAVAELRVIICGNEAGTLRQSSSGTLGFQYDSGYQGIPLSLAMPVSNRVYPQRVVLYGRVPRLSFWRCSSGLEADLVVEHALPHGWVLPFRAF